jgi:hypothetical protein
MGDFGAPTRHTGVRFPCTAAPRTERDISPIATLWEVVGADRSGIDECHLWHARIDKLAERRIFRRRLFP